MQIDRRITNGLAWAGAALVIAIPAADFAVRQFTDETPRVAVVSDEPAPMETSTPEPVETAQVPASPTPRPAATTPTGPASTSSDDAVDSFVQSGRPLPSYISDGDSTPAPTASRPEQTPVAPATSQQQTQAPATPATATQTPAPAQRPTTTQPAPAQPTTAQPATQTPRIVTVTMPTPVSQRPPSRPATPVIAAPQPVVTAPQPVAQPPLILEDPSPVITAQDLEDWESGPLSDFLASRGQQGGRNVTVYPEDYDPNGFFLDEGPNPQFRQRAPIVTEEYYYPFGQ